MSSLFLIVAFVLAGVAQTIWLRGGWLKSWARPIDGGRMWRGKRIFGNNKTWRGLVVMIPAVAAAFGLLRSFAGAEQATGDAASGSITGGGSWLAPWSFGVGGYVALGAWAGVGYMLGELPNSFVKRRLGVEAGQPPTSSLGRTIAFIADQTDSVIGALLALSVFVSLSWQTWVVLLSLGPVVHWLFNVILLLVGVKKRAA